MVRMMEDELYVYCLEKDKEMVKYVLKTAENKFKETIKEQLGKGKIISHFNYKKWNVNWLWQIDF